MSSASPRSVSGVSASHSTNAIHHRSDDFDNHHDDGHDTAPPAAKRRKSRQQLSCNECRRLKLKCDRVVPCANCIRRECVDLCQIPLKKLLSKPEPDSSDDNPSTLQRLQAVEHLLGLGNAQLNSRENSIPPRKSDTHPITTVPAGNAGNNGGLGALLEASFPQAPLAPASMPDLPPSSMTSKSLPPEIIIPPPIPTALRQSLPLPPPPPPPPQTAPPATQPQASTSQVTLDPLSVPSMVDSDEQSFGTLVMSHSGRSKFLGPTAASEWLKNQEVIESAESPPGNSRAASPSHHTSQADPWMSTDPFGAKVAYPFNAASRVISTASIMAMLPPRDDGKVLVEAYYRHFSWHFDIAPRNSFMPFFEKAYDTTSSKDMTSSNFPSHDLALLFVILAVGSYYNLELPPGDPSVEEYLRISKCCLSKGDLMATNTLAAVKTMLIMSHLHLSLDSGKNGDAAWPLWGLMSRMLVAMGLHRDGERWNLPPEAVEERRYVFWEAHSTDVTSSNCFSRPGALSKEYIDTAYPTNVAQFYICKYEMSALFHTVLDFSMKVARPSYAALQGIHDQIIQFERNIPYNLRCRPVLSVLPSTLGDLGTAEELSPPIDRRDMQRTFQAFTLALNLSELLVFLHRPFFAKALNEFASPEISVFGQSFLAVIERCNAIVTVGATVAALFPQAGSRHWWIWYHCLNSAASMGTLVLRSPYSPLAPVATAVVDSAINSYTSIVWTRKSPRMVKNLKWLVRLKEKMANKVAQKQSPMNGMVAAGNADTVEDGTPDDDDVELLGWRTRLIERVGQGVQTAKTIPPSNSAISPNYAMAIATLAQGQSEQPSPGQLSQDQGFIENSFSTGDGDILLNSFWDPITSQQWMNDVTSVDWWLAQAVDGVMPDTGHL
ncbi:hypothetical protein T439DRAFT_380485 [Meredithblackwellia eburnea MCA 4105]